MGEAGGGARRRGRPLLLGHRGARNYAPENTPAAFELALQHGCDGFEFDVRLTADRRAVVCHDATLGGLEIAQSTFGALAHHSYEKHFPKLLTTAHGAMAGEARFLCLEDVAVGFGPRAFLDIEIKVAGLEDAIVKAFGEASSPKGCFVSSFLPDALRSVHARTAIPLGYICDEHNKLEEWRRLPIRYLAPHWKLVERDLVEKAHAAGVRVFVWTVNDANAMRKFAEMGVDGLISDDTRLLARTFTD